MSRPGRGSGYGAIDAIGLAPDRAARVRRRRGIDRRGFLLGSVIALLLALTSLALAQQTTIGELEATFDGEARSWYLLERRGSGRSQSSANMSVIETFRGQIYSLNLQGFPEERLGVEGTLSLSGMLDSLDGCPCTLDLTDALYYTSDSLMSELYQAIEAEVVVESIEQVEDGVYSLRGSFTTLLGWVEDLRQPGPDASRTVSVTGNFVVDRVAMGE